jgi:hypothetical protein
MGRGLGGVVDVRREGVDDGRRPVRKNIHPARWAAIVIGTLACMLSHKTGHLVPHQRRSAGFVTDTLRAYLLAQAVHLGNQRAVV